jgi:hypothetical protein
MPDLKSELMKLQNLKFDDADDEPAPPVVVDEATTERERVWNYIKANPMSSATGVAAGLGINPSLAASQIFALHNKAVLARGLIGDKYHYQVVGDSYPRFDRKARGERLGKLSKGKPRPNRPAKRVLVQRAPDPVAAPVNDVDAMISSMSVMQARAIYDKLKQIFGG